MNDLMDIHRVNTKARVGDAETGHSLCQQLNAEVCIDGDSESPEP